MNKNEVSCLCHIDGNHAYLKCDHNIIDYVNYGRVVDYLGPAVITPFLFSKTVAQFLF